jgi:hypothetical protein
MQELNILEDDLEHSILHEEATRDAISSHSMDFKSFDISMTELKERYEVRGFDLAK